MSVLRAARVHARFVQRVDRERLAGFKSYFFRETDRHTMYYVRGRLHMLHAMRKKRPSSPMSEDVGVLSADEAEAVVFSTFVYRLYNRLDTVVRWALLRRHVADAGHDPDTEAEPGRWEEALEQLTEEELDEAVHCAQRCWSPCRGGRRVEPRAVRAVAVQPGQLSGFFACVEALRRRGIKVFTGQHQVQGSERTRAALESLLEQGGDGRTVLSRLTRDLRDLPAAEAAGGTSVAARACALLGAVPAVGPFLQYQLLLDLIEPRHSIFRGTSCRPPSRWEPSRNLLGTFSRHWRARRGGHRGRPLRIRAVWKRPRSPPRPLPLAPVTSVTCPCAMSQRLAGRRRARGVWQSRRVQGRRRPAGGSPRRTRARAVRRRRRGRRRGGTSRTRVGRIAGGAVPIAGGSGQPPARRRRRRLGHAGGRERAVRHPRQEDAGCDRRFCRKRRQAVGAEPVHGLRVR